MTFKHILTIGFLLTLSAVNAARAADVTITETPTTYTLDNGLIAARIEKRNGDLTSLRYKDKELLQAGGPGRAGAYWSLPGTPLVFGSPSAPTIKEDPANNNHTRATISIHFPYDGKQNTAPADVELLYSLAKDDSALYLMANWNHKPEYPLLTFGPGRFAAKLNAAIFNFLSIDDQRQRLMPSPSDWGSAAILNMKEARRLTAGIHKGEVEHKYDYAAVQFDTPAYGWSSTTDKIGLWLVTPSNEYMSGGPTKMELNAHLDGNQEGYPTLLNVWKGPHYGGTVVSIPKGASWTKAIGPFALYANSTTSDNAPPALYKDAIARAASDAAAWPFNWVHEADMYPDKQERSTVTGRITLHDPITKQADISNLLVGLTHPDDATQRQAIDWQHDGTYYQFWVHANPDGSFSIPNVRSGAYTLHAFANGVLGELIQANITVQAGKPLNLGDLAWTPIRYGKQLWEIGTPDRTSDEFKNGDHAHQWGLYLQYAKDFPNDVHFTIGQSNPKSEWNLMQVPRAHDDVGKARGDSTTWSVQFTLPANAPAPHGRAVLRLALAGTEARSLALQMNGKPAGTLSGLPNTMVIHRDSDRSAWAEYPMAFDASLMQPGQNTLTLTIPAGNVTAGIEYDYLRLELDESTPAPTTPGPLTAPPRALNTGPVGD